MEREKKSPPSGVGIGRAGRGKRRQRFRTTRGKGTSLVRDTKKGEWARLWVGRPGRRVRPRRVPRSSEKRGSSRHDRWRPCATVRRKKNHLKGGGACPTLQEEALLHLRGLKPKKRSGFIETLCSKGEGEPKEADRSHLKVLPGEKKGGCRFLSWKKDELLIWSRPRGKGDRSRTVAH